MTFQGGFNAVSVQLQNLMSAAPPGWRIGATAVCALMCSIVGAQAQTLQDFEEIDEGFQIFTQETFEGNGRTCATCHVPEFMYTVGPDDIPRLSAAERARLFASNVPG
jgi:cytochrome c553